MPLTTVARGRVFDWSHAVGRGAARGTGFNYIQTMCLGKNGNVIVADSGNDRLQVFSPDGKFLAKCGGPGKGPGEFNQPWGITLDKNGNIYVADWKSHRIQKLSSAGKCL